MKVPLDGNIIYSIFYVARTASVIDFIRDIRVTLATLNNKKRREGHLPQSSKLSPISSQVHGTVRNAFLKYPNVSLLSPR